MARRKKQELQAIAEQRAKALAQIRCAECGAVGRFIRVMHANHGFSLDCYCEARAVGKTKVTE